MSGQGGARWSWLQPPVQGPQQALPGGQLCLGPALRGQVAVGSRALKVLHKRCVDRTLNSRRAVSRPVETDAPGLLSSP